jgi:peptidoglycan/LPS O-acetylase OafA/YrhL
MDLRRLRLGEWMLAAAGAALLASLFMPWYEVKHGASSTGWESFSLADLVLTAVAGMAVLAWVLTATQSTTPLPTSFTALTTLAGFAASILVLVRIMVAPDVGPPADPDWGAFAGLAGALGVVAGGTVAIRDERLSPPGRTTDATGRPAAPPPEIEPLPPPRA